MLVLLYIRKQSNFIFLIKYKKPTFLYSTNVKYKKVGFFIDLYGTRIACEDTGNGNHLCL